MVFGFFCFLRDMLRVTVMIYELCMFITLVSIHLFIHCYRWKTRLYSRVSHNVSFSKIAGIRALCISLSLIEFSWHLKDNKKTFDFLAKFIEAFLFYILAVLHFTNNSYIAAEVPFQFMNLKAMNAWFLTTKLLALLLTAVSQ